MNKRNLFHTICLILSGNNSHAQVKLVFPSTYLLHVLHVIILTWPFQTAPSISALCPQFYKRTGSPASLVGGSGRNHKTTGEKK